MHRRLLIALALLAAVVSAAAARPRPAARAPQRIDPVVTPTELRMARTIDELAADGPQVAFSKCGYVGVWRPGAPRAVTIRGEYPLCGALVLLQGPTGFYSLALAGDTLADAIDRGGIQVNVWLETTPVQNPRAKTTIYSKGGCCRGEPLAVRAGAILGDGSLLVFSTWETAGSYPRVRRVSQSIWRIRESTFRGSCPPDGQTGPCVQLAHSDGALVPLAVDGGRIVVRADDGSLELLDADGRRLLSLPLAPARAIGAELSGGDLVVLVQGELRHYDAATGTLLHRWPLPDVPSAGFCGLHGCLIPPAEIGQTFTEPRLRLEDAARGLAVYVLDGRVHLRRLRDGADAVVAAGTAAQLEDPGLFYAYDGGGALPGRIRFVPFDQLPLR